MIRECNAAIPAASTVLLSRRTATWNLFVNSIRFETDKKYCASNRKSETSEPQLSLCISHITRLGGRRIPVFE